MQGERRTSSLLECYAEPQLIFSKKQKSQHWFECMSIFLTSLLFNFSTILIISFLQRGYRGG